MKNGRPNRSPWDVLDAEEDFLVGGWRRCHAQMVWQAMQAVVTVAAVKSVVHGIAYEQGIELGRAFP